MAFEGGFQGRTNKLVDGCYSFWDAGIVPLLSQLGHKESWKVLAGGLNASPLCNNEMLERYLLVCCQGKKGGMRDKPSAPPDYYHTCYCLSGLSILNNPVVYDSTKHEECKGNIKARLANWISASDELHDIRYVGDHT